MDTLQSVSNDIGTSLQQTDTVFWVCFIGMWVVCLLLQAAGNKWLSKAWMARLTGDDGCHCRKDERC